MDPQVARILAAHTTAVVEPTAATMEPMQEERMNWARNTMEETIATSVPSPRTCCSGPAQSPSAARNCGGKGVLEDVVVVVVMKGVCVFTYLCLTGESSSYIQEGLRPVVLNPGYGTQMLNIIIYLSY